VGFFLVVGSPPWHDLHQMRHALHLHIQFKSKQAIESVDNNVSFDDCVWSELDLTRLDNKIDSDSDSDSGSETRLKDWNRERNGKTT